MRYGCVFRKDCFVIFTAWRNPYVILSPNLMTVQTSKGKAPHTCKESIRGIMASKFQKELLLKLPQNKVASNIVISKKILYMTGTYMTDFTDEPVVKCDVPPIKNTFFRG